MKTKLTILVFAFILIPILNVHAAETPIPDWIKNNAGWWADGQIDDESMNVAAFLIFSLSFMVFYCTVAFSS